MTKLELITTIQKALKSDKITPEQLAILMQALLILLELFVKDDK